MSYKEKMLDHLRKAEARNDLVEAAEDRVIKAVRRVNHRALSRSKNPQYLETYFAKKALEDDLLYKQHGSVRNYHISMATMYALAALVGGSEE